MLVIPGYIRSRHQIRPYTAHTVENPYMNKLSSYNKGWLSGLIDGEGSIVLTKNNGAKRNKIGYTIAPYINIANTNVKLLNTVKKIIGEGSVRYCGYGKNLEIYKYTLGSNGCRKLLPQLKLIVKDKQRVLLLKALQVLKSRNRYSGNKHLNTLFSIRHKIQSLNNPTKTIKKESLYE